MALLLLDVLMPNMDGKEAYDRILETHQENPVLFASGYSENAIHTNFVLKKSLALIQKPFVRNDLLRMVRQMLDRYSRP